MGPWVSGHWVGGWVGGWVSGGGVRGFGEGDDRRIKR